MTHFKYWLDSEGMARIKRDDMPVPFVVDVKSAEPPTIGLGIHIHPSPRFIAMIDEVKAITGEAVILMVRLDGSTKRFESRDGEIVFEE